MFLNVIKDKTQFTVSSSGVINVKPTVLFDREMQEEHILTVVAGKKSENTSFCVRVIIEDTNDHKPNFTEAVYQLNLLDSTSVGSSVMAVYAMDDDIGKCFIFDPFYLFINKLNVVDVSKNDYYHFTFNVLP